MKFIFKTILRIIICIIMIGLFTLGIDYLKINSGVIPIFNLKNYDKKTRIQSFHGIFYTLSRKIKASEEESLSDSKKVSFKILVWPVSIPIKYKSDLFSYTIETEQTENCTSASTLYYADTDNKIYTYCLDKINVKEDGKENELITYLRKDKSILNDIEINLLYAGLYNDGSTLIFQSIPNSFTNHGLSMFKCQKDNINDIYIGPRDMSYQQDFCTYKDDDFKFIFEIEEEEHENVNIGEAIEGQSGLIEEKFYEDGKYEYYFDEKKSNYIFITTPAVRGKNATRISLQDVLNNNLLTIDELEEKGLKFERREKESAIQNQ